MTGIIPLARLPVRKRHVGRERQRKASSFGERGVHVGCAHLQAQVPGRAQARQLFELWQRHRRGMVRQRQ